jgi:hypothetical protein
LFPQSDELIRDDLPRRESRAAQQRRNVREAQTELLQSADLLQSLNGLSTIEAMTGRRSSSGLEETDLLVVVQRAYRDPRSAGYRSDFEQLQGVLLMASSPSDERPPAIPEAQPLRRRTSSRVSQSI